LKENHGDVTQLGRLEPDSKVATPNGFWAAPKAMVVKKDRSPNSAAKTKENVCRIKALSALSTKWGCIEKWKPDNNKWNTVCIVVVERAKLSSLA